MSRSLTPAEQADRDRPRCLRCRALALVVEGACWQGWVCSDCHWIRMGASARARHEEQKAKKEQEKQREGSPS